MHINFQIIVLVIRGKIISRLQQKDAYMVDYV